MFSQYAGRIVDHALAAAVRPVLADRGARLGGGAGVMGARDTVSPRFLGGGSGVTTDQVRCDAPGAVIGR